MNRKSNVEHPTISRNKSQAKALPAGVSEALEKVKEFNEEEMVEEEHFEPASSEIRNLVLFGRIIEDFKIGGYTFKLSTLSNRQQKDIVKRLVKLDNEERLTNIKTFTLSEAIISVNGVDLIDLYEGNQKLSPEEKKHEIISDFQSGLVEKLFSKYEKMVEKSNSVFENGEMKKEIKN